MGAKEKILEKILESEDFRSRHITLILKMLINSLNISNIEDVFGDNNETLLVDSRTTQQSTTDFDVRQYLDAFYFSGTFEEKPDALTFTRTVFALTGETISLGDSALVIDEFYDEVAQPTAPQDMTNGDEPPPEAKPETQLDLTARGTPITATSELRAHFRRALTVDDMAAIMKRYIEQTSHSYRKIGEDVGETHVHISRIANGKASVEKSMEVLEKLGFEFDLHIDFP